jgi:hypothetical protein
MRDDTQPIHGTCDPRFGAVRDLFAGNLASGTDVGAACRRDRRRDGRRPGAVR